ncbi:putative receptor protein kinase ZmPK1 [Abrus precatorius]|uniref:Receptor-like serine/threonine-protein kinase n=1 Tax=Abrus precatorius TaxID=3816 RepID=A0A8B8LA90_ABRPR|nr:putative receptor protein kinase ZmPK1 [Abrus precatorius]
MAFWIPLFLLLSIFSFQSSFSLSSLNMGSSLSVEKPEEDVIVSQNGVFSAGFFQVGENAYTFAIWFTEPRTIVWMANRNQPINGKRSKLSLSYSGNTVLVDAGESNTWSSNTASQAPTQLYLRDDGNLVLHELPSTNSILWQSFDFPTHTLLPGQRLSAYTQLVSSRSPSNHSSGFYTLFFGDNNVLSLVYHGLDVSSTYWPQTWLLPRQVGRFDYNSNRDAGLDSLGIFTSSDNYNFSTNDHGTLMQRRLTLDSDGNVRVYSRHNASKNWYVSWQVISDACTIHGICGANSTCSYYPEGRRRCSCLPGYKLKNHSDWSYGCEPVFHLTCYRNESTFFKMQGVEFYGYDSNYVQNSTHVNCVNLCLQDCNCKGFQYRYDRNKGFSSCFTKLQLQNGRRSPRYNGAIYMRVPKNTKISEEEFESACDHLCFVELHRDKKQVSRLVWLLLWLAIAFGAIEIVCILVVWCVLSSNRQKIGVDEQGCRLSAVGFKKFSYSELKKATKEFSEEIGRGASGIVYRGILSDQRHAAIKRLNEAKQEEGEFLAEVSIIGRLNHMNLIEMWGYCAEGKHRLLVYEYMENGSLAENLSSSSTLDWSKRYEIALGTARVLAYLHEECQEWILHCDIKPQNILLDGNYQPRVADFGFSKLLNRNNLNNLSFSMIRGTRGYMAPEWVYNLPITSKVDVYSYGIVLLVMITGKSPTTDVETVDGTEACNERLVTWVRKRKRSTYWVEQIMDPAIGPNYDASKMEILARVALDCVEEDKEARPTMRQVVEMLQSHDSNIE